MSDACVEVKILNKILGNQIHQYIERIIHCNQVEFIPEVQVWFSNCIQTSVIHHINKVKDKSHMITSIEA